MKADWRGEGRLQGSTLVSLLSLLGVALAGAAPSQAQEEAGDTVPIYALDSLVVSVMGPPVRLGDAAYPVSVMESRTLREGKTGIFLDEALQGMPGVQIQNRYNWALGERITVRGAGARAQFGVRGTHLVVDDMPATFPDGQSALDHLDIGSLGRVEVMRGPASSLYGNAGGGVLRFETRAPPPVSLRQEVDLSGGGDGLLRVHSVTAGRAGGIGYHLAVESLEFDGFRGNPRADGEVFGGVDRTLLNGQLRFSPGDSELRVTLNVLDQEADNPGSVPDSILRVGSRDAWGFNVLQRTGKELDQFRLGTTWEGHVAGLESELSGYGVYRSITNPIPTVIIDLDRLSGGLRGEVRDERSMGPVRLEWTAGASFDVQRDDRLNFENEQGETGALTLDQLERVRTFGGFLQANADFHPRFSLQGGLRYDRFRFKAEDRFDVGTPEDASGERTMDAVSPSIGAVLTLHRAFGLFANLSSSFETPTTTELANRPDGSRGFNPDLEPQRTLAYEGGARGEVAGRLRYEVTGYRADVDDQLVPFEVSGQSGRTFFRNAGSSEHVGVEAFLEMHLLPGLRTRTTYTRVVAEFDAFTPQGEDFSGNRIPGVAPNELFAQLRGERGPLWAEIAWTWVDGIPVNDANTASADSYGLVDLRVGAREVRLGSLEFSPYAGIRNLTDELYSASVTPNAFGGRFFEPGPGRSGYVGMRAAWIRP